MNLSIVHGRLSQTALMYFFILAIWAFWRFFRKQNIDSSFFGALVIAEVLVFVQGLLGGYLWVIGARPDRGAFHILYGVVALLGIPGVFAFTKGSEENRSLVVYGAVLLFMCGILLRAISTGGQ